MVRALEPVLVCLLVLFATPVVAHTQQPVGGGNAAQESEHSSRSVRTATPEELDLLLVAYTAAAKSKEHAQVAAALERMTAFCNPELKKPAQDGLTYSASKKDQVDAKEEAKALGMNDKGTIEKLCLVRTATVVDAAARVALAVGDEDSVGLLLKALGSRGVSENPPAVRAVVDALAHHPHAGIKADAAVREILFTIGADDLAGDKFGVDITIASIPGYDLAGRYGAAIRYFGVRKSKDLRVVSFLAGLLRPPTPLSPDSPSNPPIAYWEARHYAWLRYVRDVVSALKDITGQSWKSGHDDEGGQADEALAWILEHRAELGLE